MRVCIDLLHNSKSQLWQDVFVAIVTGYKREGYFVEFGATDGVMLSNSHLLEKRLKWKGLLSEPGVSWQKNLRINRSCTIDNHCIWNKSDEEITFLETNEREFSTALDLAESDHHLSQRKTGIQYQVKTLTLEEFLQKNSAPFYIDFISVDTEGSEYLIFENFDFTKYKFGVIACEHNYGRSKHKLEELFKINGYSKIQERMSLWDGWYVSPEIVQNSDFLSAPRFPFKKGLLE